MNRQQIVNTQGSAAPSPSISDSVAKSLLTRAKQLTESSEAGNPLLSLLQSQSSRRTKKEIVAAATQCALEVQAKQLEAGREVLRVEMELQREAASDMLLLDHHAKMEHLGRHADQLMLTEIGRTMEEKHRQLTLLDSMAGDADLIALKRQCLEVAFQNSEDAIIRRCVKPR